MQDEWGCGGARGLAQIVGWEVLDVAQESMGVQ